MKTRSPSFGFTWCVPGVSFWAKTREPEEIANTARALMNHRMTHSPQEHPVYVSRIRRSFFMQQPLRDKGEPPTPGPFPIADVKRR